MIEFAPFFEKEMIDSGEEIPAEESSPVLLITSKIFFLSLKE